MTDRDARLLSIQDLTVALPAAAERAHAVENISFDLSHGEILCVVGESGSGKSVTAQAVMGLLPATLKPTSGKILFGDEDMLKLSESRLRRIRGERISMIFQEPMTALNPLMRVGDQISEMLQFHGMGSRRRRQARVLELLEAVQLPDPPAMMTAYPFQLSGGQRQRVMIAMALALDPAILIADEPTTALDVTTQAEVLGLIKALQAERAMGVMFITHDFGVVAEIADRVAVMQHGRTVEIGAAQEVLNHPKADYTQRLIAAVPGLTPPEALPFTEREPIFEARALEKIYRSSRGFFRGKREVVAAKDVSFVIRAGETLGLVGESGSGKTTVGRCVVRLVDSDSGELLFSGQDIAALKGNALLPMRRNVQMVFQDPYASLNPRRKVAKIIAEGPRAQGVPRREAMDRAFELLELVGLGRSAGERYPHEFSGGQRQRIGIARALALRPKLLVADEPVSALDVSVQAQVLDLLDELRRKLDLSMLFITHDLRVAAQVCDSIAVMRLGEIVEYGPTGKVFADPQHAYTRQLLDAIPGKGWRGPQQAA